MIGTRMSLLSIVAFIVIVAAIMSDVTYARPYRLISSRQKRTSDHRLAELETQLGLEKIRSRLASFVRVQSNRLDLEKIGRKRRSKTQNELKGPQRFLQAETRNSESLKSE